MFTAKEVYDKYIATGKKPITVKFGDFAGNNPCCPITLITESNAGVFTEEQLNKVGLDGESMWFFIRGFDSSRRGKAFPLPKEIFNTGGYNCTYEKYIEIFNLGVETYNLCKELM
jgi:hypothetical protein